MSCSLADYRRNPFRDLDNVKVELMTANNTILLNAINVTNVSKVPIRYFLELKCPNNPDATNSSSIIYNRLIDPNDSINVLSKLYIVLEEGDIIESNTNGYEQKYDCTVVYTELLN